MTAVPQLIAQVQCAAREPTTRPRTLPKAHAHTRGNYAFRVTKTALLLSTLRCRATGYPTIASSAQLTMLQRLRTNGQSSSTQICLASKTTQLVTSIRQQKLTRFCVIFSAHPAQTCTHLLTGTSVPDACCNLLHATPIARVLVLMMAVVAVVAVVLALHCKQRRESL